MDYQILSEHLMEFLSNNQKIFCFRFEDSGVLITINENKYNILKSNFENENQNQDLFYPVENQDFDWKDKLRLKYGKMQETETDEIDIDLLFQEKTGIKKQKLFDNYSELINYIKKLMPDNIIR